MQTLKKNTDVKSGQLLLAQPFLADPYFRRSVVLLCDHSEQGSFGLMLNKALDMQIGELMANFPYFEADVFYGGPVQTDTLHYVHNVGRMLDGSIQISRGVWWGGDFEQLKKLIENGDVRQPNIRFFVGYTGWGGGQLRTEMEFGTWVTAEMRPEYVFENEEAKSLWKQVMYRKGDKFEIVSHIPEQPYWN